MAFTRPVDLHGQLRVEGANIIDRHGQKVALKGISLGWHNWWPQFYNPSAVEYLSHSWHISVIRAAMGIEPEGGYLENPEKSKALVKTVIDAAIANGIYAIVDWHSHGIFTAQAEEFFSEMAQQYAGYPNIIYEIFNEPEDIPWEEIKDYSVKIIDAIRKYDEHNLIIAGTPNWSHDVDTVADNPIGGYGNIVYALHFYAASHDGLLSKARYAAGKGLPLFVSECSPSEADGNGLLEKTKFSIWLDFMERNRISFVLWGLYDKGEESTAMLKPGADSAGNWPRSELTEMGIYSRKIVDIEPGLIKIIPVAVIFVLAAVIFIIFKRMYDNG
jgi:endoglucanase